MEKISIPKILANTFLAPWNNIQLYSQALSIPILLLVSIWGIWLAASPLNAALHLIFYGLYFIAFAYLAIICHQLILIDKASIKAILIPKATTLFRFIFLMIAVYLLATIIEYVIINIYLNTFNTSMSGELTDEVLKKNRKEMNLDIKVAQYIAYIPSMYFFGRFCLVFPATALGYKPSLKWSWQATKNNHLHILFIVALFPWALQLFLYALYREDSTIIEKALISLLTYISAALGIFAISLTYKELYRIEQQKL